MSSTGIPILNSNNRKDKIINDFNENLSNEDINNDNNVNNIINETEPNHNRLVSSKEWINYFKQSKINLEEINNVLLSNVESIDNENTKLKEALNELIKDLKEKEDSLDESLKIISKLKNNYSNLFHQYQTLEKKSIKLTEENEQLKLEQNILNSKKLLNNETQKNFKDEINKMKKDELNIKNNLVEKKNENMKLVKENIEIKAILEDMKKKNLEFLGMLKDREDLISEYTNQIKQLENEINNKNEQIKILIKFSKSINNENKTNVKELTKQACKTIKLFYNINNQNNINNNEIANIDNDKETFNKLIKMIFDNNDLEDLKLNNNNNINSISSKNVKITFKLKEAILNNISFDDIETGSMNGIKEYLINIFIKMSLLKLELFSSYIREFHFVDFLSNIIKKIKCDNNINFNLLNLRSKIIATKTKNEKLLKQNNEITIKLFEFKNKVNELNLYIKKIKGEFENKNSKIKEKIEKMIDNYEEKIIRLNEKIELYKTTKIKKSNNNNNIKIDNHNNINIIRQQNNNNKYLKIEKSTSFKFIKKTNNQKVDIKTNKNNQRKNFNFSLTQSIESNQKQKTDNNTLNKPSLRDSTIKKYNNNQNISEVNNKNYIQKKGENQKLKEEISRLKSEITELVQDINKQQKIISESNFQTKISHNNCDKCDNINNLIINSNLTDINKLSQIKNTIMNSSLNNNIKNIIQNVFDIMAKIINVLEHNSIDLNNKNNKQMTYIINNKNDVINNLFFSELNGKLFSSSELKKYHLIYSKNTKNITELIKIYEKRTNDIKKNFGKIKLNYDSTISEQNNISFNNNKKIKLDEKIDNNVYDYKTLKDEILFLKQEKIIFDNTIELIKNYLMINEKICNFFFERKHNIEQFKHYSIKIFNLFKESICFNLEDISDNHIFLRKLIIKLIEVKFF